MNIYEQFETDKDVEKDGLTIDYGNFSFRIARAGGSNVKYNKILNLLTKPHRRSMEVGVMDDEVAKKIMREVYAKTVVLGWDKVTDRDGKEIKFSWQNCVKLFNDLPDLFADIQSQAVQSALFKKIIKEEDLGN